MTDFHSVQYVLTSGVFDGFHGGNAEFLSRSVSSLGLSVRARTSLHYDNIRTVGQLIARTPDELLKLKNFGKGTLIEVKDKLARHGLRLV